MWSALWEHSVDLRYYLLSSRCENPRLDSGSLSLVRDPVRCGQGDIPAHGCVVAGEEDASMVDPGNVVYNMTPNNDRIDRKVE